MGKPTAWHARRLAVGEAGPMWQRVFREFGETAVEAMLEPHVRY